MANASRSFVCGDIHGCTEELFAALEAVSFDRSKDRLYALGDLVDRGPDSRGAMMLLNEPWFESIQGNHEVLMIEASRGNAEMHVVNGGGWFTLLDRTEQDELVAMAEALPVAMTIQSPTGRKIGLVHADMLGNDWDEFMERLATQQVRDYAQWARERVRSVDPAPIRNVDHVYFGHTPVKQAITRANMSWIDTGCFATGRIAVVELF